MIKFSIKNDDQIQGLDSGLGFWVKLNVRIQGQDKGLRFRISIQDKNSG